MDTTTASGELLFHVFGALARYERAMTKERVVWLPPGAAGQSGALPPLLERSWTQLFGALHGGMSKAAVCRNFAVKRTTLIETLARVSGPASG
jgi:DNA invertase Pin-like site-specific DNA recombinase